MEEIMKKRQKEIERVYEEQWDGGKGSHHPDFDPEAVSGQWEGWCTGDCCILVLLLPLLPVNHLITPEIWP
jgi:hypothetical protein